MLAHAGSGDPADNETQNSLLTLAVVKRMTTQTAPAPVAPSNLNTRQLAASLSKTASAAREQVKTEAAAAAATVPKPAPATHEPPAPSPEPGSLKTVEGEPSPKPTLELPPEPTPTPSPDVPTTEELAPETGALPPEVAEAIEIAKAMDGGKGKAEMLKRIHKLTDARDTERNARLTAEEQLKQVRTELQEARKTPGGGPGPTAPAGMHPAVHAIVQELANVDHWLGWCEEALPRLQSGETDQVELPDGKGGALKVGLKEVAKTRRDLENIRQEVVAKKVSAEREVKVQFEQAYQRSHQAAVTAYPWLKTETSPEYQAMQTIVKMMPGFKQVPDHELAIGDFLAGKALREARAKGGEAAATRKAAPSREPTKVTTTAPSSGGEPVDEEEKAVKESQQQFAQSGSVKDLARTLTASRRVSRTTKR